LYKTVLQPYSYKLFVPTHPYAFSVSKINQVLSLFVTTIWLLFLLRLLFAFPLGDLRQSWMAYVMSLLTGGGVTLFSTAGPTHRPVRGGWRKSWARRSSSVRDVGQQDTGCERDRDIVRNAIPRRSRINNVSARRDSSTLRAPWPGRSSKSARAETSPSVRIRFAPRRTAAPRRAHD
jgi:hypothetical protein